MKTQPLFVVAAVLGFAIGCGGSTDSPTQAETPGPADTTPPAATDKPAPPAAPPLDHGAPSDKYPAFTPDVGQLVNNGGRVLAAPTIVTVTWKDEPSAAKFEQFGDAIGPSEYWKQTTAEYGVGQATSGATNHVHLPDAAPASIKDSDIPALLSQHLTAADKLFPTPTDPIYIFFIPSTSKFQLQGQEVCGSGVGGYHENTSIGGKNVAFAVVPQCGSEDEVTLSASHELTEAATDPYPMARPAYSGFDDNHLAWEFFQQFQSENGDACEFYREAPMDGTSVGVPFTLQRTWSNASAAAGHNPCVPAPRGAYFNVTPLDVEDIELDLSALGGGGAGSTKGYKVKLNGTKTIPLGFYSDQPTQPWTITAQAGGILGRSSGSVDLSLDVTQGQNGQKAYLTITVNSQGKTKGELITIVSAQGSTKHYMPILIGSPDK